MRPSGVTYYAGPSDLYLRVNAARIQLSFTQGSEGPLFKALCAVPSVETPGRYVAFEAAVSQRFLDEACARAKMAAIPKAAATELDRFRRTGWAL